MRTMQKKDEKYRLLLVDDEVEFLNSTAKALERRGFNVSTARDGSIALQTLKKEAFDVVILDVRMPGISGDKIFLEFKRRWPDMPVIILTGHGTVQQAFETSRDGVFDYLPKPIDMDVLAETAHKAVEQKFKADVASLTGGDDEIRLLIIDDETELLESLSTALGRRGMRVSTCSGGVQALDIMERHTFDVALLDIKMPGIDGMDLLPRIKQQYPLTEVLILTGHPTVGNAVEGLKTGAFDYIMKPCDTEELTGRIRSAFMKRQKTFRQVRDRQIREILNQNTD